MRPMAHAYPIFVALLKRPDLWMTAIRSAFRLIPDRWWRYGPLPRKDYLDYRGNAVYGMSLTCVPPIDFIRYLEWCRAFPGPIR